MMENSINRRCWLTLENFLELSSEVCKIERLDKSIDKNPEDENYQEGRKWLMQKHYGCRTRAELQAEVERVRQDCANTLTDYINLLEKAGTDTENDKRHLINILESLTKNNENHFAGDYRRFIRVYYIRPAEKDDFEKPPVPFKTLWWAYRRWPKRRRLKKVAKNLY
jgi:hypothetical protein